MIHFSVSLHFWSTHTLKPRIIALRVTFIITAYFWQRSCTSESPKPHWDYLQILNIVVLPWYVCPPQSEKSCFSCKQNGSHVVYFIWNNKFLLNAPSLLGTVTGTYIMTSNYILTGTDGSGLGLFKSVHCMNVSQSVPPTLQCVIWVLLLIKVIYILISWL